MSTSRLTDMDIRNPNDNTVNENEDWISLPDDTTAEEIFSTERTHTALAELAGRVDTVREQGALEAYQWAYKALTGTVPEVERKHISLESYTGTITKKSALAKAIRVEADKLNTRLTASIESYAADIEEDFNEAHKVFGQANRKLRATDASIDVVRSKRVEINHTRIFEMLMVNNEFKGKDPLGTIDKELKNLERLAQIVDRGVESISNDIKNLGAGDQLARTNRDLPDTTTTMQLMFNRKVKINEGHFDHAAMRVRQPKKSYSWSQIGWLVFGGLIFNYAGYNLAKVLVGAKKDSESKVSNNLKEVHRFIRSVEGLEEIVADLSGLVQSLTGLFKQIDRSQESALNRRIVPVMELINFIMKQVVDITKGTDSLFTKIVRKHSK